MRLWFKDPRLGGRKDRSAREAEQAGFTVVSSLEDADVVALHERDVKQQSSSYFSRRPEYEGKLILIYAGDDLTTVNDIDIQSQRVLYIKFHVGRSSQIIAPEWRKIHDYIINDEDRLYWRHYELYPPSLEYLSTLSILCQGYLAAHGQDILEGWERVPKEIKRRVALTDKQSVVSNPKWWLGVLAQDDDWESELKWEAEEMAWLHSLSGEAAEVKEFIGVLKEERVLERKHVAPTHRALRKLLGASEVR